ncbi:hypothetical protein Tco_0868889 [Tanacetum coccineum]
MAALESCPKHNMIAYLEKTDGNAEFHDIIDFLTRISIHYALTGSGGNHRGQSSSDRSISGNEDGLTLQSVYDLCISLCKHVTLQAKEIKELKAQIKKLKKKARPVITHHKAWMKSVTMKTRLAGKKSMKKNWMQKESDYNETEDALNEKVNKHDEEYLAGVPKDGIIRRKATPTQLQQQLQQLLPTVLEMINYCSKGVNEAERKFGQLANDEEIARMVQEEWESEEEKKRLAEEKATKAALIKR